MRHFAAVALTSVASAVKTSMWGIDLGNTPSSSGTNAAWIPAKNDFDFASVFGNKNDVFKPKTDKKVVADTKVTDTKTDNMASSAAMTSTPMSSTA